MKHADKVISLMAAHPGRDFRMHEIARYVCPSPQSQRERSAINRAVHRVVEALVDSGSVMKRKPRMNGGFGMYRWKVTHAGVTGA